MTDSALPSEEITIQGLSPDVLAWLNSERGTETVSLAHRLVAIHHWNLILTPAALKRPALLIGTADSGVVIMENRRPLPDEVEQDQKAVREVVPKGWLQTTVVYLLDDGPSRELQQALKHKLQKNLSTKSVTACAVKVADKQTWGNPPKPLLQAVAEYQPSGLLGLLQTVLNHQDEMDGFLEKLHQVTPWGTYALMACCFVTFAWAELVGGTTDTWTLLRFGANYTPLTVGAGEWWRLLGAAFLHIGYIHILVNMYSLYAVGPTLEKFLGNLRYLGVYTLSALAGSLASAYFGGGHISAGASGAIFGLLGSTVVLGVKYKQQIPKPVQQSMVRGMLPAIVYNLLFGFSRAGIDNSAHLGGLLAGALITGVITPRLVRIQLPAPAKIFYGALAVLIFLNQLFVFSKAVHPLNFAQLPSHRLQVGRWTLALPNIFQKATDGDYYEGPGINVFTSSGMVSPDISSTDPKELTKRYSQVFDIPFQYIDTIQKDGRTWYRFRSNTKSAGYFEATQQDGQEIMIGAFTSLDHPQDAQQLVEQVVSTVQSLK